MFWYLFQGGMIRSGRDWILEEWSKIFFLRSLLFNHLIFKLLCLILELYLAFLFNFICTKFRLHICLVKLGGRVLAFKRQDNLSSFLLHSSITIFLVSDSDLPRCPVRVMVLCCLCYVIPQFWTLFFVKLRGIEGYLPCLLESIENVQSWKPITCKGNQA